MNKQRTLLAMAVAFLGLFAPRTWAADPKVVLKLGETHPQGYRT